MHIFDTLPALNTALQALGLALFHSLWQGIVIGLLCSLLLRMMHKKMASSRFMVAYAALILLFLSFTATFYAQFYALSSTAQEVSFNTAISDKEIPVTAYTASSQESRWEAVTIFYQACIQKLMAYAPFIVALWLLGFFWYTAQLIFGFYQVQQMRSKSFVPEGKWLSLLQHLQHKMKIQKVQLLISSQADAPFTLGWLRPVILLPPGIFTELSADQLEAILVHELAHIKRHDYLLNIMQSVIEVFLFFNPIYWYLASVLEKEREQACDQITINVLHQPVVYARALTRLAETSHKASSDIAVAAVGKQYLKQRIHNIIHNASYTPHRSRKVAFKWYQLTMIIALGITFTILTPEVQGNQARNSIEQQITATDAAFIISGQVTNQESGEPLPGINIIVKGTTTGTVTNPEGMYQIKTAGPGDKLVFFFTGYKKEEVKIENQKAIDVEMQKEDQEITEVIIEEVLMRGYVIDSENDQPLPDVNIKIKGANHCTTNGSGYFRISGGRFSPKDTMVFTYPGYKQTAIQVKDYKGKDLNIKLKKEESIQNSENVLYVIDGVVQGSDKNVLDEIAPSDIKSVEVFKSNSKSFNSIAQTFLKGRAKVYDGIIMIKTKDENSQDLSNMKDQTFDNNLIVFPNPSDGQLTVQFQLEETAHIHIEIVDMNSQSRALLADKTYNSGTHQAQWSEAVQKSRWYLIKVTRGAQVFIRKVCGERVAEVRYKQ